MGAVTVGPWLAKTAIERSRISIVPERQIVADAKPGSAKPVIDPRLHERWARMVAGEIGLAEAPEEVQRLVARTISARKNQPRWKGKPHEAILDPEEFQALGSKTLDSELASQPAVLPNARRIVLEEWSKPVEPNSPTHFWLHRVNALDAKGDMIKRPNGTIMPTTRKPPYWARGMNPTQTFRWQDTKTNKGPMEIHFYRLER